MNDIINFSSFTKYCSILNSVVQNRSSNLLRSFCSLDGPDRIFEIPMQSFTISSGIPLDGFPSNRFSRTSSIPNRVRKEIERCFAITDAVSSNNGTSGKETLTTPGTIRVTSQTVPFIIQLQTIP